MTIYICKKIQRGNKLKLMKLISSVVEENGMKEGTNNFLKYYFSFLSFFFPGIFIYLFIFILIYNTVLVLPYIDMNLPRVYMSSQS